MDHLTWQTELPTVRERIENAFNKSLFCDVEFSVQDLHGTKVTIPANKYILAVSSSVFEAMFYGQFEESHKSTIDLPDCTKEGLYELLRYVYSDKVNLTESNVIEVLYLAEKYMMPFLVEKCKNHLKNNVGPKDVLSLLSLLPKVQEIADENLQKHMWNIVDWKTRQIVSSESFLNVSQEMLCQILVRDTLSINELDLFRAVDRWVEKRIQEQGLESNGKTKRSILGEEVVRLIRFPLMLEKEFAEVVLPCEILQMPEVIELEQSFLNVSPATNMFSKKKRYLNSLLIPSIRFDNILGDEGTKLDAIDFTVNKPLNLIGVQIFGSKGGKYDVVFRIYKGTEVISKLSSSFVTESDKIDDLYYGFKVHLDRPARLDPNVKYTVLTVMTGPPSHYGISGRNVVHVENDITITYKNLDSLKPGVRNGSSCADGQFPTLFFQRVEDGQD